MNFDVMRQKLIERAIKGELVPQLDSEPAVEQIGETPAEVPFEVPVKWKWVQLSAAGKIIGGGTPKTSIDAFWENGTINWFTPADFSGLKGMYVEESDRKITTDGLNNSSARLMPRGTVIYSSRAPIGYIAISTSDCTTSQGCKSFCPNPELISSEWAYYSIRGRTEDIKSKASGTTFKEISGKVLGQTWIPLPPLEEQRRIVEKLNTVLETVDKAEAAHAELVGPLSEHFRNLCLERAIRGTLVPQRDDEPAVEQIGKEPAEVPFEIPAKWKWIKLGTAFNLKAGKFISSAEIQQEGPYPCYGGNGIRGFVNQYNKEGRFAIIGRQGALCGNIKIADGKFYATEHAVVADGGDQIDPDCAAYFLQYLNLNQYATQTAQPGLSVKRISDTPFPLPPLAEQRRIVEKLNNLLANANRLIEGETPAL